MWTVHSETLANSRILKIAIEQDASPVPYAEVLRLWQADAEFRSLFIQMLADAPFEAFRWETPPLTIATANRPFECVLLNSPGLASRPDQQAFAEHFGAASADGVVEFANLGKDAILVVPSPLGPPQAYGHIAAFVRQAPQSQQHAIWAAVGAAMQRRLSSRPVWLSTAGAGVSWLHVRLDDRPKYYGFQPYRDWNA